MPRGRKWLLRIATEVVRLIPDSQAVGVQAGHMIPWENLEDFLDVINRYLSAKENEGCLLQRERINRRG